ncbi:HWE histidine kinase domain-containing protein [Rhizobium helianthi]|uniref:histidine kinase n=1 Tax=Rhizobium helianthi TaxID=1132695 RepID=A0ABW4M525_9HYPH
MATQQSVPFLQVSGQSARLVLDYDWSQTPLGHLETWPISLRTAVANILNSSFPAAVIWGRDMTTIYNDAFRPLLGQKAEAMGRPFSEVWAEVWPSLQPIAAKAYGGEPTFIEDFALTVERNGFSEEAYFTFCYSPLFDDEGRVAGILDTVVETTARVEAERRMHLMNAELQHRMKNMFATVNSIVSQTLRVERPLGEIRALLLQRLATLAAAHAVVTEASKGSVPIRHVIEAALAPHRSGTGRMRMEGPDISLAEKPALSLSLAVNELATNAIKYGAFSRDGGTIAIFWSFTDEGAFELTWQEQGGPPVSPPQRRGFGTTLMERVVAHDFAGTARISYEPAGLHYRLTTDRLPSR